MSDSSRAVSDLLASVRQFLRHHALGSRPILLAVSGGGDSTAMFRAFVELLGQQRLRVAHLNHGLRGFESDEDSRFVAGLCAHWRVPLVTGQVSIPRVVAEGGGGTEATARDLRYQFLQRAALDLGCTAVATAHTADDQTETVLLRILRGTGLAGLGGIPVCRDLGEGVRVYRPLLDFTRGKLLQCLEQWQQPFRTDATNQIPSVTRTRVRLELLPRVRGEFNRNVDRCLRSLAAQAREIHDWIGRQVDGLLETSDLVWEPDRVTLAWGHLQAQPDFLLAELFIRIWDREGWPRRGMTSRHWSRLTGVLRDGRRGDFPGGITVQRSGPRLELWRWRGNRFPGHQPTMPKSVANGEPE